MVEESLSGEYSPFMETMGAMAGRMWHFNN